jgi:hypothetical protein
MHLPSSFPVPKNDLGLWQKYFGKSGLYQFILILPLLFPELASSISALREKNMKPTFWLWGIAVCVYASFCSSVYGLPSSALQIETAAVRLRWVAETNIVYQVQWSHDMIQWSNVMSVIGTGELTNILEWTEGPRKYYRHVRIGEGNLKTALAIHFPLNGNANDESGNGNHGILYGVDLAADRFGRAGKALHFNGTNSYIEIPHTAPFESGDFSISLWFLAEKYPDSNDHPDGEAQMLVSKGRNNFELHLGTPPYVDSGIRFLPRQSGNVSEVWDARSAQFKTNSWQHLVAVYKSDKSAHIYLNGVELPLIEIGGGDTTDDSWPARLGMRYGGGNPFKGVLDDVRIFSRAINEAEVKALYFIRE